MNIDKALAPLTHKLPDGSLIANSDRWKHAESETLITGKLGYGNVSGWARGTTKAIRPEFDLTQCKPKPTQVHNMRELREAATRMANQEPAIHNPDSVTIPVKDKDSVDFSDGNKIDEIMAVRAEARQKASDLFARLFSKPMGEPYEFERNKTLTPIREDSQPGWYEELKRQNEVSKARS
jgi:hypothetical protein